jgi:hypothetical protein
MQGMKAAGGGGESGGAWARIAQQRAEYYFACIKGDGSHLALGDEIDAAERVMQKSEEREAERKAQAQINASGPCAAQSPALSPMPCADTAVPGCVVSQVGARSSDALAATHAARVTWRRRRGVARTHVSSPPPARLPLTMRSRQNAQP